MHVIEQIARDNEKSTTLILSRSSFTIQTHKKDTTLHVCVDASTKAYWVVACITDAQEASIIKQKLRKLTAKVKGFHLSHHLMSVLKSSTAIL